MFTLKKSNIFSTTNFCCCPQVTNPPIDPIREKCVMSLSCPIGPEANLLEPSNSDCERLWLDQPILSLEDLFVLKNIQYRNFKSANINIVFDAKNVEKHTDYMSEALDTICARAEEAVRSGHTYLILSDRQAGKSFLPVSPLLLFIFSINQIQSNRVNLDLRLSGHLLLGQNFPTPEFFIMPIHGSVRKSKEKREELKIESF